MTLSLASRELVGVYLFLVSREGELDETLWQLKSRIEKELYGCLSIEEFEHLGELYRQNSELFRDEK